MRKNAQKNGIFQYNIKRLNIENKTTGQCNFISNIKWAALKKQGPRGSYPPLVQTHKKLDKIITVRNAKGKATYNYLKLL